MAKRKRESLYDDVPEGLCSYEDRFPVLMGEAVRFCNAVGLPNNLLLMIMKSESDWAFALKVDALLESAAKHILRHGLSIRLVKKHIQNELLEEFVDSLPMNGRTSLLKLLDAAGMPEDELGFMGAMRIVRNAYAHEIEYAGLQLLEVVKLRQDKSTILKHLSAIRTYDEANLIAEIEKDPPFFRFLIIDSTMRVLFYAYHLTVKEKRP